MTIDSPHGTNTLYRLGCRCDLCIEAKQIEGYKRRLNEKRKKVIDNEAQIA